MTETAPPALADATRAETSCVTTLDAGGDYLRQPDGVGVPGARVRRRGGRGRRGGGAGRRRGRLWIRGPNVVKGCGSDPESTAATITDRRLHSGDVARLADEDLVHIDRAKDMTIRGGENVYCIEVESALFEHPAVTDAAADVSVRIWFLDEPLPRDANGKIMERELKQELLGEGAGA